MCRFACAGCSIRGECVVVRYIAPGPLDGVQLACVRPQSEEQDRCSTRKHHPSPWRCPCSLSRVPNEKGGDIPSYISGYILLYMTTQYMPFSRCTYFLAGWPSSLALSVATWMARAMVDRTRPSSMASKPAIVHPPGATSASAPAEVAKG